MTTRMVHPQHGATHAYGEGEIARHKALGWTVVEPVTGPVVNGDTTAPTPAEVIEEQAIEREAAVVAKRKPGRQSKAK